MVPALLKEFVRRSFPRPFVELAEAIRYAGLPEPFRSVRSYSLLSNLNLFFLQELARRVDIEGIEGDFVECGVYRGGSAGVLAHQMLRSKMKRRLWLFDAFAGMPAATQEDDHYSHAIEGRFVGSERDTHRVLRRIGLPEDSYKVVVGWFDETLPQSDCTRIALLHVDCDFYDPVRLVLERLYPSLQPGGYVILNDYGSFQGCRKATDEFLPSIGSPQLIQIDHDAYYFRKMSR